MDKFVLQNFDQIILLLFLLIMSATFSGCETALFSLKTHDLNRLRKSGSWVDSLILELYKELPDFLLTILLGNMIVNILYFSVATLFVDSVTTYFGAVGGVLFGIISFCGVLIGGEIAPKSIASVLKILFARIMVIPIYYIHRGISPLRHIIRIILHFFERIINLEKRVSGYTKEISALLELEKNRGTITAHEADILESVIELPEIKAGYILTPRVDVNSVSENASLKEVIRLAQECGHNKIPVRSQVDDEYIAWVDARDLFFADTQSSSLQDYYRDFIFISVYDRCDSILDKFVNLKDRIAFVLDERGATAGILVLSDVLAELFGDFGDEETSPEELVRKIDDHTYILDGRVSLRDWEDIYNIRIDSLRSNTIGGLITDHLGRSALVGDTVIINGVEFQVTETKNRRIQKVAAKELSYSGDPECGDIS